MKKLINTNKVRGVFRGRETISLIMILSFFLLAICILFVSPRIHQMGMHEGDIALKDVYAPYDFTYYWGVDDERTGKAIERAEKSVPYTLQRSLPKEEQIRLKLDSFFKLLLEQKEEPTSVYDKSVVLQEEISEDMSGKGLKELLEVEDQASLKESSLRILDDIFLSGFISEEDMALIEEKGINEVVIFNEGTGVEIKRSLYDLINTNNINDKLNNIADKQFPRERNLQKAVGGLILEFISPNLEIDVKRTTAEVEDKVKSVDPVLYKWEVEKNELIIGKGTRIDAMHIAQMSQIRKFFRPGTSPTFFFGVLLLFFLLGLIATIYAFFTQKSNCLGDIKDVGMILLNMLGMIIISDIIVSSPPPSYFIPMASIGMILMLIIGFSAAFLSVLLMSILMSLLLGGGIELMVVLLVGSVVGIYAARGTRRRTQILLAGVLAGIAKFIAIVCIGLINGMDLDFYVRDGLWGIASGLLSGFIVMGVLPVFEHFFKVTTNISLLELSDLNHPLLKKLATEAPGTYHHSIMVGNLAEAACDSIGANSLLARVGAYYHDIGKIAKAEYFTENELGTGSRHSSLTPSMSALIISTHVKEGLDLARKFKLTSTIKDFICQHHGDSLISFFYQKALEKSENGIVPDEDNFRYPGPKPQTKETAIIMLADAVEASSRALSEPTPASIRNLVRKIINNKFIDGQLDECDLSLRDMHNIADSFVRVLTGIFHTRLDYPDDKNKTGDGVIDNGGKNKQRKPKQ